MTSDKMAELGGAADCLGHALLSGQAHPAPLPPLGAPLLPLYVACVWEISLGIFLDIQASFIGHRVQGVAAATSEAEVSGLISATVTISQDGLLVS